MCDIQGYYDMSPIQKCEICKIPKCDIIIIIIIIIIIYIYIYIIINLRNRQHSNDDFLYQEPPAYTHTKHSLYVTLMSLNEINLSTHVILYVYIIIMVPKYVNRCFITNKKTAVVLKYLK